MNKLKKTERVDELNALAAMSDEEIDTTDIPELTVEQLKRGKRGLMYRPITNDDT